MVERVNMGFPLARSTEEDTATDRKQQTKKQKNLFESFFHALCHNIFKALYISFCKTLHYCFKSSAGAAEELIMLVVAFTELLQRVGVGAHKPACYGIQELELPRHQSREELFGYLNIVRFVSLCMSKAAVSLKKRQSTTDSIFD